MEKKIVVYTLTKTDVEDSEKSISKSFTTKRLAEQAKATLATFGVEVLLSKETKTFSID